MRSLAALPALCLLIHAAPATGEPLPNASDVPAEAILGEFPFRASPEPNRIVVDLSTDSSDRPLELLLDTGATFSVFTPRAAQAAGVPVRRLKRDPYRRPTRLGRDLQFFVDVDSSDTASRTGWEYALLGGNFLESYVVELDFAERVVRLIDPKRYSVPETGADAGELVLPLRVTSNRPSVELSVNGAIVPFLIDTGSWSGLVLSGGMAERLRIETRENDRFRFGTVWGEVASELGEVESLAVGDFRFEHLPVVVLPHGWFNMGLPDDAVIGYDLLSQFLVRLDYPRRRLWLRRRPDWRVTWRGAPWSGWETEQALASTPAVGVDVAAAPPLYSLAPTLDPARVPARRRPPRSGWSSSRPPRMRTGTASHGSKSRAGPGPAASCNTTWSWWSTSRAARPGRPASTWTATAASGAPRGGSAWTRGAPSTRATTRAIRATRCSPQSSSQPGA